MEVAKSWVREVISEGLQAISDTFKVLGHIRDVEEILHDMFTTLSQEADVLREILNDWEEIAKSDIDALVTCDVLPSCEMFYRHQGLLGHKEETLRKLITKLQAILGDC